MNIKRTIYGLPIMRGYRRYRTTQLASISQSHPAGFDFPGSKQFFLTDWELKERQIISDYMKWMDVLIDVGANHGFYACLAAVKGIHVAALEPEAGNLRFLTGNISRNNLDNVEIFPIGISDSSGVSRMFGDGDCASLVPGWHSASEHFSQVIAINTLDNLFSERWIDQNVFIKVDVEGLEYSVVNGAEKILNRKIKPNWLIETFPVNHDKSRSKNEQFLKLFQKMETFGYIAINLVNDQRITMDLAKEWYKYPNTMNGNSCNFLFKPAQE